MRPRYWLLLVLLVCAGCGDKGPLVECPACGDEFRYADRGDTEFGWVTDVGRNDDGQSVTWASRSICDSFECLGAAAAHNIEMFDLLPPDVVTELEGHTAGSLYVPLVMETDLSDLIIRVRYPGWHEDEGEDGWYIEVADVEAVVRRVLGERALRESEIALCPCYSCITAWTEEATQ